MTNPSTSERPVLNLLADMTRMSVDVSSLDAATLRGPPEADRF
jgi:hypothetical protein